MPSGSITIALTCSADPDAVPSWRRTLPPEPNDKSKLPFAPSSRATSVRASPLELAAWPATTILPSGWMTTAFRSEVGKPEPGFSATLPSPSKLESGAPLAVSRATSICGLPLESLASPTSTILPSGCTATAVAPDDGLEPAPICSATLPPLPKELSGVPSELKRATETDWAPLPSKTLPLTTSLPSDWTAMPPTPLVASLTTVPPLPNEGSKLSSGSAAATRGHSRRAPQAKAAAMARPRRRLGVVEGDVKGMP